METLETRAADFEQADAVFCALGTTRAAVANAAEYRRIDVDYVEKAAAAARAAGVPHFALVSSQGANKDTWYSELKAFHGFFYMHVKGLAEAAVSKRAFPRTSIYRPGMLDRGGHASRGVTEAVACKVLPSTSVADLARAMIFVAERDAVVARAASASKPFTIYETPDIRALAKQARMPPPAV